MPSDTALNLVNKIFIMTGDNDKVATVVGSVSDIAERAIHFLNIGLNDVCRLIDFDILNTQFQGTGNGTDSQFIGSVIDSSTGTTISVTVDTEVLSEVSRKEFVEMKAANSYSGTPIFFTRISDASGNIGVDIYPAPASGQTINVHAKQKPSEFTVSDTSTTEITDNDLLVLAAIAHMDTYAGIERGYMKVYEIEKRRRWTDAYKNRQFKIVTEDYR